MDKNSIGIDFGTTKTLVAYPSDHEHRPEIANMGRERYSLPTSAFMGENGAWEFGDDADDYACDPYLADRYTSKFKLKLGSSSPVLQIFGEQGFDTYTALDVTAKYLEHIRRTCEKEVFNGQTPITSATISHPIHFSPAQIEDLKKAAELAGFSEIKLIREPEAAGLAFCRLCPKSAFNGTALIVDWGGGTLDLALVSRENNEVKVHGNYVAGSDTIGGVIFDELLWKHVAKRLHQEHNIDIEQDTRDAIRLQKKKVCAAKEKLSRAVSANLSLSGVTGVYPMIKITREEFEKTIHDYVQAGIGGVVDLINSIKEESLKPTQILLIGGSSQIPLIGQLITEETGLPCNRWQFSHEAVALGTAMEHISPEDMCRQAEAYCDAEEHEKAFSLYQQAAEQGCAEGQAGLGLCYMSGLGVEQSSEECIKWLRLAADQGHADAQGLLGLCYKHGIGVPQSHEEALKWFRLSAEKESFIGQTGMGDCYASGKAVSQSFSEAEKYFRKAAEKDYPEAQGKLAHLYIEGLGVEQSYEEAAKWFRKAAEKGDADAQLWMGLLHTTGKGVPQSDAEAVKWYRKAVEQDNPEAQFALGRCYATGQGVAQSDAEAVKWYQLAAAHENPDAQMELGNCYGEGHGVQQSYEEAYRWFKLAAEQDLPEAQARLGICYHNGLGVSQSAHEAVKWFRRAAEQGYPDAQYMLADSYSSGQGVPQSDVEAVNWYLKAAEQGQIEAQMCLFGAYHQGIGVAQSVSEAIKWITKAANQGSDFAQNILGVMYLNGDGVAQSPSEAVKWLSKAANSGNKEAQFNLAQCYYNGEGVPKSRTEAFNWCRLAAEQGHEDAIYVMNHEFSGQAPTPALPSQKIKHNAWNPINAFVSCMKRYVQFSGRASRSEYWYFVLVVFVVFFCSVFGVATLASVMGTGPSDLSFFISIFIPHVIFLIPSMAVQTRRLHDMGRSAWWLLFLLLLYPGKIILLIMSCFPGKNENNPYGSAPLPPSQKIKHNAWNPINAFVSCMKRYVQFSGRASRSEYWFYELVDGIIVYAPALIAGMLCGSEDVGQIVGLSLMLPLFMPSLTVQTRRLHDMGRSAWWLLFLLLLYPGKIILLIMSCFPGKNENNPYGSAPLPPV